MIPEFLELPSKTSSPLSPLPNHSPEVSSEVSSIADLRNQAEPTFNMTTTHIEHEPIPSVAVLPDSLTPIAAESTGGSPSSDSSFSDAYKEQPVAAEGVKDEKVDQAVEVSDDYAMTFDSDGEENTDSQDITQANIQQQTESLPITVPATESHSFISVGSTSNILPQNGQDAQPTQTSPPSLSAAVVVVEADSSFNSPTLQDPIKTSTSPTHTYEDITNGGIDIQQLLDNITANAEKNEPTAPSPSIQNANSSLPIANLPAHSSLPPRPQMPTNPFNNDMQKYHAGPPGVPPQSVNSYRPPGVAPPSTGSALSTDARSVLLPPPPSASFRQSATTAVSPISPTSFTNGPYGQAPSQTSEPHDDIDPIEERWGPDVQKIYDKFLADERMYVTEGLWDRFPPNSRLFIGNLPSEKVTKRDLFHVFHKYGKLAQVSIKQAYGFIQFHESSACEAALRYEQNAEVRGRKMHLEISRPQPTKRSRSPDHSRENMSSRGGRQGRQGGRNTEADRYDGRPNVRDEYGRPLRTRDDYRPARPVTPPRTSFRGRDDYNTRGRDSYDGRDRHRSRSRSPYDRDSMRYRERSPSPRIRLENEDGELQIPRREPQNVPDVQIILMDQLDRGFVSWVEGEFHGRGIKTEVMFLSSRLPLEAVIRRQILEGVHAVSQLTMRSQNSSKVPLQVFDRQGGANNVRFDEYQDLEPRIAAELVLRAKSTPLPQPPPPHVPQYAPPNFTAGQSYQAPTAQPVAPNLANLMGHLDSNTLQNLLSSLQNSQHQNVPAAAANPAIDLASLLGGLKQHHHPAMQQGYAPQTPDPYPSLATQYLGGTIQQQAQAAPQQQSAQQVSEIMAQLSRFRQ